MRNKPRRQGGVPVNKRNAHYSVKVRRKGPGMLWRYMIMNTFGHCVEVSLYTFKTQVLAKKDGVLRKAYYMAQ